MRFLIHGPGIKILTQLKLKIDLSDKEISRQLMDYGLDPEIIALQQQNIKMHLSQVNERFFPIVDTCRLDNGGILPLPSEERLNQLKGGNAERDVIAFVPAAGASTRYLAPLFNLIKSLSNKSRSEFINCVNDLVTSGLSRCPLPATLKCLMSDVDKISDDVFFVRADDVLADLELPKALYPAVETGETFLEIKRLEHQAMKGLAGEVFICPPGRVDKFLTVAERVKSTLPMRCYEQGPVLSTVRFEANGELVTDENNKLSLVPGGHGTLLRLFRDVARDFPHARSVFIRNIDNVAGTSRPICEATDRFLEAFRLSFFEIQQIRLCLKRSDKDLANDHAKNICKIWGFDHVSRGSAVTLVLEKLFYASMENADATSLFDRPFVLMGQVPNTGKDVGGSCVLADVDGVRQKLCLELPHASPSDRSRFLSDPKLATHFNPVFVAAEIPSEDSYSRLKNNPFWLVTKKRWENRDVYYQESILYELLGSSQFVNVLFVDVPRSIFNPHKALADAQSKSIKDWVL